jgi:subtilase family serine protease
LPLTGAVVQYIASGAYTSPKTFGGASEASLDIEVVHEIAPNAQELLYFGANEGNQGNGPNVDMEDVIPVYNQIITDNLANIVSVSYDVGCEETEVSDYQPKELDMLMTQAAAQGITFTVAA